jgi:hypothetical protein
MHQFLTRLASVQRANDYIKQLCGRHEIHYFPEERAFIDGDCNVKPLIEIQSLKLKRDWRKNHIAPVYIPGRSVVEEIKGLVNLTSDEVMLEKAIAKREVEHLYVDNEAISSVSAWIIGSKGVMTITSAPELYNMIHPTFDVGGDWIQKVEPVPDNKHALWKVPGGKTDDWFISETVYAEIGEELFLGNYGTALDEYFYYKMQTPNEDDAIDYNQWIQDKLDDSAENVSDSIQSWVDCLKDCPVFETITPYNVKGQDKLHTNHIIFLSAVADAQVIAWDKTYKGCLGDCTRWNGWVDCLTVVHEWMNWHMGGKSRLDSSMIDSLNHSQTLMQALYYSAELREAALQLSLP